MRIQPVHILILILIVALLFGANRLPGLAKSVGQSLKIFKSEVKDLTDEAPTTTVDKADKPDDGAAPTA